MMFRLTPLTNFQLLQMRLSHVPLWKKRTPVWLVTAQVALASAIRFGTAECLIKSVQSDVVYAWLIFMTNGNQLLLLFGCLSHECL